MLCRLTTAARGVETKSAKAPIEALDGVAQRLFRGDADVFVNGCLYCRLRAAMELLAATPAASSFTPSSPMPRRAVEGQKKSSAKELLAATPVASSFAPSSPISLR